MNNNRVDIRFLGLVPYKEALELQLDLHEQRLANAIPDTILILEHPPVITLGKSANANNVLVPKAELQRRGIQLWHTDRGGDATFHGPGQLVCYFIVDLRNRSKQTRRFVSALETAMINTAAEFGVSAQRLEGLPGVWVGTRKLGAIGLRISRGVTYHGLAFNVNVDLSYFELIVPCGIKDKGITSLERELGHPLPLDVVARVLAKHCSDAVSKVSKVKLEQYTSSHLE